VAAVINGHRVLIADDHQALRRGVRLILEKSGFRVVAECDDGPTAIGAAGRLRPEICLLDIHMPGGGIEAAAEIHRVLPDAGIVMLTVSADSDDLFAAVRAGACGYLLKDTDPDRLPLALRGVLEGEAALPRALVLRLIDEFRGREHRARTARAPQRADLDLTPREWEVLDLLAAGYSTSQIGARLTITGVTVRSHVATIMRKLQVTDREAAVRVLRDGYEPSPGVEDLNGQL
jgi:DNA-binding NarL/FixJ family response regulator